MKEERRGIKEKRKEKWPLNVRVREERREKREKRKEIRGGGEERKRENK